MKLFVTGAAGRLGRALVDRLAGEHEIVAFERADRPAWWPEHLRYVQGDVRDPEGVREAAAGAEAVVHLAAIPGRAPHLPQPELFAINVQGTFNVLDAAPHAGARMVVLASSLCAIGLPDGYEDHGLAYLPVDEAYPCQPRHTYDLSKLLNEESAAAFTRLTGIATVCFRFPLLANVRNDAWFRDDLHRDPPRLVMADYLDQQDAVSAIEAALNRRDLTHEVLFAHAATAGTPIPTSEYLKRFCPEVEWRGAAPIDTTPLINCERIRHVLNFAPTVTWQAEQF